MAPLERPEIIGCRMAVRFPTVDKHAVSLTQLICLLLVGKLSLARQNDKAKKRQKVCSVRCMRMDGLQRADLLQMEQGCSSKG